MKTPLSRRQALSRLGQSAAAFSAMTTLAAAAEPGATPLKGNIRPSVCRWCYNAIPLETLCKAAREIGLLSIELQGPDEWPVLRKHDLTCAMANGAGFGIERGWNNPELHDQLVESYEAVIPKVAQAGLNQIICFSGNRRGLPDDQGILNCAKGLKRLMPVAERHRVTVVMELLNSRVNHKDYQCDHTAWGVELCKAVASERFKLLYDIYHMQIMEGDVIATIRREHSFISHYHTGGVPGRNEIDQSQELNYPAIMRAILDTGFKGFVAQEFIPKRDPLTSLSEGVRICDV